MGCEQRWYVTEIEVERDFRLRSGRINLPVPEKGKTYRRDKLIGEETEAQREMVIPISMQREGQFRTGTRSPVASSSLLPAVPRPRSILRPLRLQGPGPGKQKVHLTSKARTDPDGDVHWGVGHLWTEGPDV